MAQISIENIMRVSIADNPTTLSSDNVNVIGIFSNETPLFPMADYVIYKNPTSAMNDWGINSMTYKMVNTIYSQSLNVLAGGGYVVVFPLKESTTVSATSGSIETQNLLFTKWKEVEKGCFNIKVDSDSAKVLKDLNFKSIKSVDEIVEVLNTALTTASAGCKAYNVENEIKFISNSTGVNSKVVISSTTETGNIDLTGVNYLNVNQMISVDGKAEWVGKERLQDAVVRCKDLAFFEGIIASYIPLDSEIIGTAEIIQSMNKMFFVCKDTNDTIFTTIKNKKFTKTRCLYNGMEEEILFACAYASKVLSVNFNGDNTVLDIANKELVGVQMDTTINDTLLTQLKTAGVDCYASLKGQLGVVMTSGKNEWVDFVLFKNWLKNALETAGFNVFRQALNVPATNDGVLMLENAYKSVFERAKKVGFVHSGKWNLPYTFGDQESFLDNIEQVGYYCYSIPVSEQAQEEREERIAPACQSALKMTGSYNQADLVIYINL